MPLAALTHLFSPRAIAVIGVSRNEHGVGRQVFENIRRGGYAGALYAVNPNLDSLAGARVCHDVASLPDGIDLAIVAVPAEQVPATIEACGARGVRFAIVVSAGFAEAGERGLALQHEMLEGARRHQLQVIGPNCLGLMRARSSLNASFSAGIGRAGKLALVSQSGAICSAVVDWAAARGVGLSTAVSLGAAADLGMGELLDFLALDPETDAILLYVEGTTNARRFMSGLRAAARLKPVVVVKAGRHPAAGRAAASHTGALVGDDAVFDAALRRAGAVRVATLHELFSAAEVLAHAPRAHGDRLAIVTNAGGLGVLAVDRAEDLGLGIATLANQANPIDVLGDAPPERYRAALDGCLSEPGVHGVLVLLSPQVMTEPLAVAQEIADAARDAHKPVLASFMGGAQIEAGRARLVEHRVPSFDSPEAAVEAFATLAAFARNQKLLLQMPGPRARETEADLDTARSVVEAALREGRSVLSQLESRAVLGAFSIPCVPSVRASRVEDAVTAANRLGYPCVLKIDSPDITHKTDVGGVRIGIRDAAQLTAAWQQLMSDVQARAPKARLDGAIVEPMVTRREGRELLVGIVRDPAFGPAIALGAGGTLVELLKGLSIALPPLNSLLVAELVARSSIVRWLGAFRGQAPVNMAALEHVLLGVSELVCELPEVRELDINPLLVDADGAIALDARIVVERRAPAQKPTTAYEHLAIAPFPRHLVRKLRLHNGQDAVLRPIRPEDAELEQRFVRSLSLESRHFRFLHGLAKLTPEMLVRFTQLDYDRELALIVTTTLDGVETEIGVARYASDLAGEGCEFALVIADAFHRQGLGAQLMTALLDAARAQGRTRVRGEVLIENGAMLELMRHLGFTLGKHPEDRGLVLVTKELS